MKTELQSVTLMNYDFKNSHYNMTSKNLAKANWSTTTAGVFRAATSDWKPATRDGNALVLGSGCQFYFKTNYRLPLYESAYANYVPMTLNFTFQPKTTSSTIIEILTYDPFDPQTDLYSRKLSIGFRAGSNGTICGAYIFRYTASGKPDQVISEIPSIIDSSTPYPRNIGTVDDSYTLSLTHRGNKITVASIKNNITGQIHYFVPTSGVVVFEADYLALRVTATVARIYSLNDTPKKDVIVTFNSNGGSSVPSRTLKQGSVIGTLPISTKVGHDLLGWYTTLTGGSRISSTTVVNSNSTYYAHWTSNTYTVTFNSNGGTAVPSQQVAKGGKATIPTAPTRAGYRFVSWLYADSSIERPYDFNNPVYSNIILIAKWEKLSVSYKVVFDSNGGSAVSDQTVMDGEKATSPYTYRTGYTFNGWYYKLDSSAKIKFNFNTPIHENTYLIADWIQNTYKVMFDALGGSPTPSTQVVLHGQRALKPTDPSKSGYSFTGWYSGDSSTQTLFNFNTPITSSIVLRAGWQAVTNYYTVTFNTNGGSYIAPITVKSGSKISATVPTKSGYRFLGWYVSDSSSAYPFDFNTPITYNLTLYARWEAITYVVRFNSDGGSAVATQYVAYGQSATKPVDPTKSGYKFVNWCLADTSDKTVFNFNSKIYWDINLIATWTKVVDSIIVTFNSAGGSAVASQTISKGSKATKPADPVKSGYIFNGWYLEDGSASIPFNFNNYLYSNTTLVAHWTIAPATTYTVTFNSMGGSAVSSQTIVKGSKVTKPANPTKSGYTFDGWYTGLDSSTAVLYDFNSAVYSNFTLYATWKIQPKPTYTVTFNSNGGTAVSSQTVQQGSKAIKPTNPTKSGYTFDGWYISDGSSEIEYNFNNAVYNNITLMAHWTKNVTPTYTVTFDSQGGSAVTSQQVTSGGKAVQPTNPTKSGYTFKNWRARVVDSSGGIYYYIYNFNTPVTSNITLYAFWEAVPVTKYTVTFNSMGGSTVASQSVEKGKTATEPTAPTKASYTFAGWYIMDGSSEVKYNFSNAVISNITLIAHWTYSPTTYTITYNANGHGTTPATVYNATKLPNPLPSMSASGYSFVGWYTNSALTMVAVPGATISANTTLYAKWTAAKTYTVAFNSNGGSAVTAQSVVSGNKATKPTNPTRSGYTFVNWYIADGSSEIVYNFNSAVYSNITLIAHWTKDPTVTYTVNFNSMGGTSVPSQRVEKGKLVTKPNNPSRTNYTFNGWYIMDGSDQISYNFNSAVYSNLTLYASWTYSPTTYTVTFNSNGGSTVSPKTVISGGKVTKPSNPYRNYYDFVGWYYSPDSSSYVEYNFNNSVYSNLTLTAEWKLREYNVTFNTMGGSAVPTQKVAAGYRVIRPSDPTKPGYLFKQWCYYDASEEIPFDFDTTVFYNLSLMATWTPASSTNYTVKFYDRGVIIHSITLPKGSIIPSGSIPSRTRSGFTFKGWYLNGTKADLTKPLSSDMNLEAEWQSNGNITLALDSHGETDVWSKVSGLSINSGSLVVHVDGYDWFYDGQYITVPDGSTIQLKYSGYNNRIAVINPSGSTVAVLSADSDGLKNITINGRSSGTVTCSGDTFVDANYI